MAFCRWRGQVHHHQNKCGLVKAFRVQHMTEGKEMDGEHTQKALMEKTMKNTFGGGEISELFLRTVGQHRILTRRPCSMLTLRSNRKATGTRTCLMWGGFREREFYTHFMSFHQTWSAMQ